MLAMIRATPASRALSMAMRSASASTRTDRVASTTGRAGPPVAVDDGFPSRGRSIVSAIAGERFYAPKFPERGQTLQIDPPCTKWYNRTADSPAAVPRSRARLGSRPKTLGEDWGMATAVVEERQLLKSLRWWDGFTIALCQPGFLLGSLLAAYGSLGAIGAAVLW